MPRKYMTVFGVVGLLAATIQIQGQAPAADYTASQAQAGDVAYQNLCASCHLANLAGASDSPQLAGPNFLSMWGGRPARDLFDYLKVAMPPAGQKPSDEDFTNIVAYILQQNGVDAGDTPLVATAAGAIGTTATARVARAADQHSRPPQRPQLQPARSFNHEVADYRPVTDATLRNPDPGNWLMFRRTYDGRGYSPSSRSTVRRSATWSWHGSGRWTMARISRRRWCTTA